MEVSKKKLDIAFPILFLCVGVNDMKRQETLFQFCKRLEPHLEWANVLYNFFTFIILTPRGTDRVRETTLY